MNDVDIQYRTAVQVTGPLAERLDQYGLSYRTPIQDSVAVEPEAGADPWSLLNKVNLRPNKIVTIADLSLVVGKCRTEDGYHPLEVWAVPNRLTHAQAPLCLSRQSIAPELLLAASTDLAELALQGLRPR